MNKDYHWLWMNGKYWLCLRLATCSEIYEDVYYTKDNDECILFFYGEKIHHLNESETRIKAIELFKAKKQIDNRKQKIKNIISDNNKINKTMIEKIFNYIKSLFNV